MGPRAGERAPTILQRASTRRVDPIGRAHEKTGQRGLAGVWKFAFPRLAHRPNFAQ